ncbi:MAG: CocE/NonD family hydrolase [Gammaproteobacteria bacterium]
MRFLVVLLCLVSLSAVAAQPNSAPPDDNYVIQNPVLIKTRDGAEISAIVVRKKGMTAPMPVALFYTTYYEGPGDAVFGKEAADHGYIGVIAYSRDVRTDIKHYVPYIHDGDDADDVINWIARQSWCNGKVGMYEGSYTGFVQWSAVRHPPAALKTIVPQVPVMPGFDFPMENNVHSSWALSWSNDILGNSPLPQNLNVDWYAKGAAFADIDRMAGHPNHLFQLWLKHPAYDSYWRSLVPTPQEYAALNIPILWTDGYYDGAQIAGLQYAREYFRYNKHPGLYAVIGPYDHFGAERAHPKSELNGYKIDPVADVSMRELVYQWFDYVMKGGPKPPLLKDRINYEMMGENKWRHVHTLAQMHNHVQKFYLSTQSEDGNRLLDPQQPGQSAYLPQTVDFKDRDSQNNYFTPVIVLDKLDSSNGLVFATRPFDHDVSIGGSFSGSLTLAINKQDVDFSIAFYEQTPDGNYFYLNRYLARASYAQDRSHRHLLTPGAKTTLPLGLTSLTARQFVKGSRLVIIVNVNKHPYDEINYGTAGSPSFETIKDAGQPLRIKWFNDSYVTVPVQQ